MAAAPKSGEILQQQENLNQKNKLPQKIPKSLLEKKVIELYFIKKIFQY